jgi:hypothetical protein
MSAVPNQEAEAELAELVQATQALKLVAQRDGSDQEAEFLCKQYDEIMERVSQRVRLLLGALHWAEQRAQTLQKEKECLAASVKYLEEQVANPDHMRHYLAHASRMEDLATQRGAAQEAAEKKLAEYSLAAAAFDDERRRHLEQRRIDAEGHRIHETTIQELRKYICERHDEIAQLRAQLANQSS